MFYFRDTMNTEALEIRQTIQIYKTPLEVYEAIADPAQLSQYFIARSTGRLENNIEIIWHFPEFTTAVPVTGATMVQGKLVSFYWGGSEQQRTLVEISLEEQQNGSTKVSVSEKSMPPSEAGIKWLAGNSGGWANFLACLKAYLEYGINLRKGAFDFMRTAS